MTLDAMAARLVEAGMSEGDAAAKRTLIERVLTAFARSWEAAPTHLWWIPGRLEVFGKHTDYGGGRTLVSAVPRGFFVAARSRGRDELRLMDATNADRLTLVAGSPAATHHGWRHYAAVVASRLRANFPGATLGADVVFASDLPRASGMSSSSALVVGLATALAHLAGLTQRPEWTRNITSAHDEAGYYACIENGHSFGTLSGDAGVGTHGGSEDHAAILTGRPGHLSAFSFVPMRPLEEVRLPEEWRFVIAPSGVRAAKTGAAQERYNRLSHGAQVLLEIWNRSVPHQAVSLASAASSADAVARLHALVHAARVADWPAAALVKRLDHFIREDARVPAALDAFRSADRAALAVLSSGSQADADELLANQVPETRALARSALAFGAFAACSFGAGFGGSVWALVDKDDVRRFAARWHPNAFVATPGPSLTVIRQA